MPGQKRKKRAGGRQWQTIGGRTEKPTEIFSRPNSKRKEPVSKPRLRDTIDKQKYNLVDMSDSESDTEQSCALTGPTYNARDTRHSFGPTYTRDKPRGVSSDHVNSIDGSSASCKQPDFPSFQGNHWKKKTEEKSVSSSGRQHIAQSYPASTAPTKVIIDRNNESAVIGHKKYDKRKPSSSRSSNSKPKDSKDFSSISAKQAKEETSGSSGFDITNVLKSVVSNVLNAPDIQTMISSLTSSNSRDELLHSMQKNLAASVMNNPDILDLATPPGAIPNDKDYLPSKPGPSGHTDVGYRSDHDSDDDDPNISLLGKYTRKLFEKVEVPYRLEDSTEKSMMLLIDYQAKFLLRDGQIRVLPLPLYKHVSSALYCRPCRKEFSTIVAQADHEYSYLHQMITGDWWTNHQQPPKYLRIFNSVRNQKTYIWCIICFEKHGVESNESLFQHLKSTHHQFNLCCWKECYDMWPNWEWCLWKDVESVKHSLPRTTVNGYDWSRKVFILPR